jgi:hypothetical protein
MNRAIAVVSVVIGLGFVSLAAPTPSPSLVQKLNQRVKFEGFNDPKMTLGQALDKLAKLGDVDFEVNEKAFQGENIQNVLSTEITVGNPIPTMKNVRFRTLLRKVLARVNSESGAAFLLRDDTIEITTAAARAAEIWGEYTGPHLPLVNANLDKIPLENALKELSEQTGFNLVLDNRAAEKAKTTVSARLRNMPLDTALRLLTDMTDLRAVHVDNALYVTIKENAAALEARLEKEKMPTNPLDDQSENPGLYRPRKGTGPGMQLKPKPNAGA